VQVPPGLDPSAWCDATLPRQAVGQTFGLNAFIPRKDRSDNHPRYVLLPQKVHGDLSGPPDEDPAQTRQRRIYFHQRGC